MGWMTRPQKRRRSLYFNTQCINICDGWAMVEFDTPSKLAFPTCVSWKNLPYEHNDQALDISKSRRKVMGIDNSNEALP